MDDAEAEVILASLPPRLEWTVQSDHMYRSQEVKKYHFYTILTEPDGDGQFLSRFAQPDNLDWNPVFAPDLEKAKIACERHYATGRWKLETAPAPFIVQLIEAKTAADERARVEAEAEAAAEAEAYVEAMLPLRKLPLTWIEINPQLMSSMGTYITGSEPRLFTYWVSREIEGNFIMASRSSYLGTEQNPILYRTEAEAKSACERHHATGSW